MENGITKPLEAKFITTVIGTNPSQDEGYWEKSLCKN